MEKIFSTFDTLVSSPRSKEKTADPTKGEGDIENKKDANGKYIVDDDHVDITSADDGICGRCSWGRRV